MNSVACNIFYTDDDKDDQDIFVDAAHEVSASLKVIIQSSGHELISLLKNAPPFPDIIFLDLNMPVKNGYEVLKEIKQSINFKYIPVIIFSTSDDTNAINTTRQLGASLYITKPSSFSSLKSAIKYTLSINWETFETSEEGFVYRVN